MTDQDALYAMIDRPQPVLSTHDIPPEEAGELVTKLPLSHRSRQRSIPNPEIWSVHSLHRAIERYEVRQAIKAELAAGRYPDLGPEPEG